ncbi:hypothetical protein VKT23_008849 [Stygiomarasmius scandens]|uniref:RlpA-like protein double-psi beta-barrel domain-containing protein n=1 Tax=Marasmiellus scandens TaxID=2682957 RepID=A0ABR1JGM5_9AGAR
MFFKTTAVLSFLLLPLSTIAQSGTGRAAIYPPGLGACGNENNESDLVVAVPRQIFNNELCNKQMNVDFQGRSVQVTVVDVCGVCGAGDIDLSRAAFGQLADLDAETIQGVQWSII